ncbi:Calx-beta domain-containing protein [Hydrocarboniphaga sp.]|uniref:Calx-beta domain-containing protein n=1 Tax=Hydrocarboniphaga sp. TaxID=2033016 RepID=UPI003D102B5B
MQKSVFPMLISAVAKRLLLCVPALLVMPVASATADANGAHSKAQLAAAYGQLPLGFEANRGQFDASVRYLARGQGYSLFLTADEAVLSLQKAGKDGGDLSQRSVIRARLLGAAAAPPLQAEQRLPGHSNYFTGNQPDRWVSKVERYGRVRYQGVYPGVDLVYYGNQGELEYDFVVAPNADAKRIRLHYSGVERARLTPSGELKLQAGDGEVVLKKPIVYQDIDGRRVPVQGRYAYTRRGKGVDVAFKLGAYDRAQALVIDPVLVYSTYLGGTANEFGSSTPFGIAVNRSGEAYVIGSTLSTDFPMASPSSVEAPGQQAFVAKFSSDGSRLIYSTYIGGSGLEQGTAIALNGAGEAYITGTTTSEDFPTKNPLYAQRSGGQGEEFQNAKDAFVARLSADGSSLLYSTYLGGSDDTDNVSHGNETGFAIAVDSVGQIYVGGQTTSVRTVVDEDTGEALSTLFPTQSAVQTTPASDSAEGFITKFAADGQSFVYSTFLGGAQAELIYSIVVDAAQQVTVAGQTTSTDFPVQSAFQPANGGGTDAFVTSLAADGRSFRYSTYLGGAGTDASFSAALGADGKLYLTGSTSSADFPKQSALDSTIGGTDAFVSVLAADGSSLQYSSYLGGTSTDIGRGIALDGGGHIYVTGYTSSTGFPLAGEFQSTLAGNTDAFVTELAADGSSVLFSSFLGGSAAEQSYAITVDAADQIYIAGITQSTNLKTEAPLQASNGGGIDAFVARIGTLTVVQPGQLSLDAAAYSVAENAGTVSLTVKRTGGSSGAAAVDYATANGSATADSDYTAQNGTLTWADGDSSDRTITLDIGDDSQLEPDETFSLSLSGASVAALGSPASATVTIENDDASLPGTLQFDAATYFVDEAGGSLKVNVSRTGGQDGAASVSYATSTGTATAGSDYGSASGRLDWADGDASTKSFLVTITDDAVAESNETFSLALSAATGASLGTPASATATIADDESVQPGVFKFDAASYSVGEAAGTLTVAVLRDIGSDGAVSVNFATSPGSATAGSDYTAKSGKLNWADGDSTPKYIVIAIGNDSLFEDPETFRIFLGTPTGGAVMGSPNSVFATINDNDVAANGSLQLDAASYQTREDGGSLRITVNRVDGGDGAVSVRYATTPGTASSNVDFTAASGTLSWASGDSAPKTVDIAILQDSSYDPRETFGFTLSSPTGGAKLGSPSAATITLLDDEVRQGTLKLSDSAFTVDEAAGVLSINVLRSDGSDGAVSVDYSSADGAAVSPGDYTAVGGTLTWADGDSTPKIIDVPIVDDSDYETTPETLTVTLAKVSGGATLGAPDTATVTIRDNEVRPGSLQFDAAAYRAAENSGALQITVNRVGGTDNAISVHYATEQGTAISGSDYRSSSGTLQWAAGDATSRLLTVQLIDDGAFEGDETFGIVLTDATGGASLGGPATATVTIVDDEVAFSGGIHFGASAYQVDEAAGSIAIAVVRGGSTEGSVTVAYGTVNGQAVSGADYIAKQGTLVWAAGDMEPKTIAVQVLKDSSIEGAENFSVVLSNPSGGVTLDDPSSASVTITDASSGDGKSGSSGKGGGAFDPRLLALLMIAGLGRRRCHIRTSLAATRD